MDLWAQRQCGQWPTWRDSTKGTEKMDQLGKPEVGRPTEILCNNLRWAECSRKRLQREVNARCGMERIYQAEQQPVGSLAGWDKASLHSLSHFLCAYSVPHVKTKLAQNPGLTQVQPFMHGTHCPVQNSLQDKNEHHRCCGCSSNKRRMNVEALFPLTSPQWQEVTPNDSVIFNKVKSWQKRRLYEQNIQSHPSASWQVQRRVRELY